MFIFINFSIAFHKRDDLGFSQVFGLTKRKNYMMSNMSRIKMPFGQTGFLCGLALLLWQVSAAQVAAPAPVLQYTADQTVGPAPLTVRFNSPSTDSFGNVVTQWFWSFGDGATANLQNPNHTYTNNGTFVPVLQATNINGATVPGIGPTITVEAITGVVSNGGFETGDFSGWSLSGDTNDMIISENPLYAHAGVYGAQLGPKRGALSQTLTTTPGTPYLLSFWLDSPDSTTNEFGVSWGTNTLFDRVNIGPIGWTNLEFEVTATQTNTLLNFAIQNAVSWFGLDQVDVEALIVAPASNTVACGATTTFSVASNNEAFVSYQWYGLHPDANPFPIPGGTNSVLTLTNVLSGLSSYDVVCSNTNGSFTSDTAVLDVIDATPPPVITPDSQTVQCGSTVTFSVTNEPSAISYQWYALGPDDSQIPEGTNASLAFTNVSVSVTNYIVVVVTSCGSYTSVVATLTVVDTNPPSITLIPPDSLQVLVNSSFTDPGVTVVDACGGTNVSVRTNLSGVNINVPGSYTITYVATDQYGNSATNFRAVQVLPATYYNLVLNTSNLLGFWPFTPSSQANGFVSTNVIPGTNEGFAEIGGPGSGPMLVDMPENTALWLNGNPSYVNTGLVGGLIVEGPNADQGSIIGWFNLSTLPSLAESVFEIAGESQFRNDFDLQIDTNNEIGFYTDNGSATSDPNALTASDLNIWHFVAATFTSDVSRNIYLDGVLVASSQPGVHNPESGGTFAMGASDFFTNRYFQGSLADIAIFNRQLSATEVANLYGAATMSVSVSISSPTNEESFTTNQGFAFSASAVAVNGIQQLALYVNSVQIASGSTTTISTTLTNLSVGSYALTAVATDNNNLTVTSSVVHVTVNIPGTTLIDFDAVDASGGPVSGAALSAYLGNYGVEVGGVTPGTTLAVQEGQNFLNGTATVAFSQPNLLTQYGTNGAISYTLFFNPPCTSVSWERTELLASASGLLGPSWTAIAFDGEDNEISQIGEGQILSLTNVPAKAFTLSGSNIYSVTFAANNTLSTLATLPLDNLVLSTLPLGPLPQITLTASNIVSAEPGQITLAAQASENGGSISRIDFYENQGLIGSAVSLNGANVSASLGVTSLAPGVYAFNAVATDANGAVSSSMNFYLSVTQVVGVSVINFDDLSQLDTTLGAVGGTNLANYLAGFGITISNATLGTRLEAISENSFSGNELPLPMSLPNLFTQVGSSQPVTFSLYFATSLQSFSFSRVGLTTNGPSGISHPAWTASALDGSGNVLESVSEPLLFSLGNIPPRTFTLYGNGIASVRFDSDSQQSAAFAAVLLDDLVLDANESVNPLSISLNPPEGPFTAPASIPLSPHVVDGFGTNYYVAFYSGPTLIGTNSGGQSTFQWTNVLNGTYQLTAQVIDTSSGYALFSAPAVTVTVAVGGNSLVVNFDDPNAVANLTNYLATNGMMSLAGNSPGTAVVAENQTNATLDGSVIPSSLPNLLTQIGSNGPVSFTVDFSNLLGQFSFTRPELVANPSVTHPAWQVEVFDALGQPLAAINAPQISSATNVPAQTYTLTNALNGGGIASVEFNSESSGFATFNGMLLDDFVLTTVSNLPPSVLITSPTNGQVFTALTNIPITAEASSGSATITGVGFYYAGTTLAGSAPSSPFSITWNAPANGAYVLTAVATNNSGLTSTSAPVSITIQTGFAIVTQPTNQTVGVSNSATFSVTTSPTNGVSYSWLSNGTPISGATLATYTAGMAQNSAPSSSTYSVIVSSGGQSLTSSNAVLTVLGPPTISSPSSATNVNVDIGSNVTLSVTASDVPGISFYYQWQRNGQFITGATNSFYTISNAQPFSSGHYQVLVANAVASQESPIFSVAVSFGNGVPTTTNDNFASSVPIDPLIGPVAGINNSASIPPTDGPPLIAGKPAAGFLWYNWTASFTGVISLTTLGSSFDTLLGVYTGSYPNNLTTIGEDDDSGGYFTSLVSFNCVQGITYQIAVAGYKGATGNVVLGLAPGSGYRVLAPNSGDAVPVITQQPVSQIVTVGDTVTNSVTASNATTYQWYFAGAPVSTINSNIVVFTSATVAGVNTNFLVISNFPAGAVGNYYALAANAVGGSQSATVAVEIAAQSTNGAPSTLSVDKFGDAVDLEGIGAQQERSRPQDAGGDTGGFTLSQSFSTTGATKEEGEPNHAGQPGGASYWYTYTEFRNGSLRFDTTNSTFNTILAVYTSDSNPASFQTLANVGAAYTTNYTTQGQPSVLVHNLAITRYYIAIDGYQGASGAAHLNVNFNPANVTLGSGAVSVTNKQTVVTITSPANNSLTLNSNITVKGTIRGSAGNPPETNLLVTLNGTALAFPIFGHINSAGVLIPASGGVEEVAQETIDWAIANVTLTNGANVLTAQITNVPISNLEILSPPATHTVFYVTSLPSASDKSSLTLVASPSGEGRITGQPDKANLEINKVYTVKAVPIGNCVFSNWTSTNSLILQPNSASLTFLMSSNLSLQANFVTNPFTAFAGVYNGLFSPTNGVTEASSGFFTATLPASSRGAYSAKLLLGGGSYPFSGTFDLSLQAGTMVTRSSQTPLAVVLQLTNDQITGSVIDVDASSNGWTSALVADRAAFNARSNPATNYDGRYTLIIPPGDTAPTNEPGGYGYAILTNNLAGHVALSGRLGDGVSFSQSVPVATNGNIPLYVSLYSRKGSFQGWLTLTHTTNNPAQTIQGTNLAWIKISSRPGTLYAGGFTNTNVTVLGSFYIPPQTGMDALTNLTNGTLTISNGSPGEELIYSNLTIVGDKLINGGPGDLSGVITPGTGVLTVTFRPGGADRNTVAKGVVLQDNATTNAAGWFLDTDQSGYFLLQQK
jgi:hypothetical protein